MLAQTMAQTNALRNITQTKQMNTCIFKAAALPRRTVVQSVPTTTAAAGPSPRQFGKQQISTSSRGQRMITKAAQAEVGKLISRVEIPAFIPRSDIMDQLWRWAIIEVQESGVANMGCPTKVVAIKRGDILWGFNVAFMRDGDVVSDIRIAFDEEVTLKHEWVGRGADGFPQLEGNAEEIQGKNLEIRKVCDRTINESTRSSIRELCQMLVSAINKYYAFGSCFVDDAT